MIKDDPFGSCYENEKILFGQKIMIRYRTWQLITWEVPLTNMPKISKLGYSNSNVPILKFRFSIYCNMWKASVCSLFSDPLVYTIVLL